MTEVVLYGKAGCCLCDDAKTAIEAVRDRHPFSLREIDVSLDPVLHNRYGERIPVVEVDGVERFELHVDPADFENVLGTVGT
jgi:glutaredoxin